MHRTIATAILVAWLIAAFETGPASAAQRQCKDSPKAESYLLQPVDGMTAAAIADDFLAEDALSSADESTRSQLRATVIAFEDARESPESAAEILAGQWDDWRAQHMTREQFVQQFLAEVSNRKGKGVPVYGATLQAAQALRNRLDDLHDAAGARTPPEGRYEMWLWDSYLRGKAAADEVEALQERPDGKAYWNEYIIRRKTTIKCVAAKLDGNKQAIPSAAEVDKAIAKGLFPTGVYLNPDLLRAIYEGRTDKIRLADVGLYLTVFVSSFTKSDVPECRSVVSQATLMGIAVAGSQGTLEDLFGGLAEAHRNQGGSRDDLFGQGFKAGAGTIGSMALSEASARKDAQAFYDVYGCKSPVAVRFFRNVSDFAKQ